VLKVLSGSSVERMVPDVTQMFGGLVCGLRPRPLLSWQHGPQQSSCWLVRWLCHLYQCHCLLFHLFAPHGVNDELRRGLTQRWFFRPPWQPACLKNEVHAYAVMLHGAWVSVPVGAVAKPAS